MKGPIPPHHIQNELVNITISDGAPEALRTLPEGALSDFQKLGSGALVEIVRVWSRHSGKTKKMLETAIKLGLPIDGEPGHKESPLSAALVSYGEGLSIALWLLRKGASANPPQQEKIRPIGKLVHRMTQMGWGHTSPARKKTSKQAEVASLMIKGGADIFEEMDFGHELLLPIERMLSRLMQVKEIDEANAFMDVFWRAGNVWDPSWDRYVVGRPEWKDLPDRARGIHAEMEASALASRTAPASAPTRIRGL